MIRWNDRFNTGDVAFILVASAVQLLIVWPGLIAFYVGVFGRKDLLEVCRQFLAVLAAMSIAWCLWANSIAFSPAPGSVPRRDFNTAAPVPDNFQTMMEIEDAKTDEPDRHGRGGIVGGSDYLNFEGHLPIAGSDRPMFPSRRPVHGIPNLLILVLHMMLFVAAPAPLLLLMIGRIRPAGVVAFAVLWGSAIYSPLAHWVWGDGWLETLGVLDCSGGLLHVGVGFSALACAVVLGRQGTCGPTIDLTAADAPDADASITLFGTLLFWGGTALLQSALLLHVDGRTVTAFFNSHLAACAGSLSWVAMSSLVWRRNDRFGICAGAVSGLVAISPGCGFMGPQSALITGGVVAACTCSTYELLRPKFEGNESLIVFVLQGLAGMGGCFLVGVFATSSVSGFRWDHRLIEGAIEGNLNQVAIQALGFVAAALWGFVGTLLALWIITFSFGRKVAASVVAGPPPFSE